MQSLRPIIFFLCLIAFSCKQEKKENSSRQTSVTAPQPVAQFKDTSISKGVVHPKISCIKDTVQNYALYLPASCTADKVFPVIYFFDSHAEGLLPVQKYQSLAEKYGYIIAGSNNSRNGLPWETTQEVIKTFFIDVQQKFSVDLKRIYAGGFSGGARVAGSAAIFNDGIAGVIGCGAGFPPLNQSEKVKFDYVGIAGNADFNLVEMKNLDRTLETSASAHQLIIFDGKHEWPPVEVMEEAFQFFEISAMKNGTAEKKDSLIHAYLLLQEKKIKQLRSKNRVVALWDLYRKLSVNLYDLTDVSEFKSELISMEGSPGLIKALNKELDEEKEELTKQQEYSKAFTARDFAWWNREIKSLKRENTPGANRLLGYLGLGAYMYSVNALNKAMYQQAENFLNIYSLVEPENPEHRYLLAQLAIKTGNQEKAIALLKAAAALGFKDKTRLENDENFSLLRSNQGYMEVEKMLVQ